MGQEVVTPHNLDMAFAVWAAVVGLIGAAIVFELSRMRGEVRDLGTKLNLYIVEMERRVATIEAHLRIHSGFSQQSLRSHDAAD